MSPSEHNNCPPEALQIAWRLKCRGYDNEEAAIRALRRKVHGLSLHTALAFIRDATVLLDTSIQVLKKELNGIGEIYRTKGEISQEDMEAFMPLIEARCPNFPEETRRSALWSAMIYHMR
jgi:hypothetical protein